jgi:quaternary ammonium compound-resistance protein SugE
MSAGAAASAIWEDVLNRPLSLLAGAVVFEVSWAVLLKLSDGLTRPWPSVATAVAYVLSLLCLNGA